MNSRSVASKELTVADIQVQLDLWMGARGSRDWEALTAELRANVTWKSAARASVLASYSDLYVGMAKIAPTGVLPAKKTAMAFVGAHKQRPVNFGTKGLDIWSDEQSGLLRAGFQKFREISRDAEAYRRCMAKAPAPHNTQHTTFTTMTSHRKQQSKCISSHQHCLHHRTYACSTTVVHHTNTFATNLKPHVEGCSLRSM